MNCSVEGNPDFGIYGYSEILNKLFNRGMILNSQINPSTSSIKIMSGDFPASFNRGI